MTPAAAHAGLMRAVVHDRFDKLPRVADVGTRAIHRTAS